MKFTSIRFGVIDAEIHVDSFSAVDSFIESAYSETLNRPLKDHEIEQLNDDHADIIQEYSYENGSRNHN